MSDGLNDDDIDLLAAEYVLGSLAADERTRANVLLDVDHGFRAKVRVWERRLGELHLMVEPVEPDRQIWERIRGKIGGAAEPSPAPRPAERSELERQIEEDLAVVPAPAPAPAHDPVAELERALEQVRTQEAERLRAAAPPLAPTLERPSEPALAPQIERLPEVTRTSAPETISRGHPNDTNFREPARFAPPPDPDPDPEPEPEPEVGPRVLPVEPRRTLVLTEDQVVPPEAGHRRLRRWRVFGVFMLLVAASLGGLISAWRYAPERLPPQLRPTAVLNLPDAPEPPPKKVAPPGSQFDE